MADKPGPAGTSWEPRAPRWPRAAGRVAVLTGGLVVSLLPLVWTLLAALGLQPAGRDWRGTLTFDNFVGVVVFEPAFGVEFAYTLVVTGTATLLTLLVAFPAAYRLARVRAAWIDWLTPGLLVLAVSPSIASGLPLSSLVRATGLYGTFPALVLACAAAQLPLALWLLRSYLLRVPVELEEAARLDGAAWLTALLRVVLPVLRDGLVATGVLVFVLDWNLYLLPTLLADRAPHLLTVVMRDFFAFERELEWPTAAAALLVSLLPAGLLVFGAQRALEGLVVVPEEGAG